MHGDWMRQGESFIQPGATEPGERRDRIGIVSKEDFKWLLIDSCGATATLAVGLGGEVLATAELPGRAFSAEWPAALRRLLTDAAWDIKQLQLVGVVHGPGSFTGVRVGLAAAKGLCEAVGAKMIAVSRLEVIALLGDEGALAVLDAGRDEFYVRDADDESLLTRAELMAAAQERIAVTVDARVVETLKDVKVVALEAVSALSIMLARWRSGMFADVAMVDANYVRGERDIYARKPAVSGSAE
jgi:tRNA threonylcarbamoyladenosine biosynthesis protein TsaB